MKSTILFFAIFLSHSILFAQTKEVESDSKMNLQKKKKKKEHEIEIAFGTAPVLLYYYGGYNSSLLFGYSLHLKYLKNINKSNQIGIGVDASQLGISSPIYSSTATGYNYSTNNVRKDMYFGNPSKSIFIQYDKIKNTRKYMYFVYGFNIGFVYNGNTNNTSNPKTDYLNISNTTGVFCGLLFNTYYKINKKINIKIDLNPRFNFLQNDNKFELITFPITLGINFKI